MTKFEDLVAEFFGFAGAYAGDVEQVVVGAWVFSGYGLEGFVAEDYEGRLA